MDVGKERLAVEQKLDAIRKAAQHDYPAGDIETMLAGIERGRSAVTVTNTSTSKVESKVGPC
jgi:hypothetical protein